MIAWNGEIMLKTKTTTNKMINQIRSILEKNQSFLIEGNFSDYVEHCMKDINDATSKSFVIDWNMLSDEDKSKFEKLLELRDNTKSYPKPIKN